MRRTSGRPASAVSIGIATEASSSSAPIEAFWTMTLKTGADRSGNTSRRSCWKLRAPKTAATRTARIVNAGRAKAASSRRVFTAASVPVLVRAAGSLLGFRLQQECAVHDDGFAHLQAGDDLDVVAEVATAADRTHFELLRAARHERKPLFANPLQRVGRDSENRRRLAGNLDAGAGGHARSQNASGIGELHADGDGPRSGIHLAPDLCDRAVDLDRKSTRLNSSHLVISYA